VIVGSSELFQFWPLEMNSLEVVLETFKSPQNLRQINPLLYNSLREFTRPCFMFTEEKDFMCSDSLRNSNGDTLSLMIGFLVMIVQESQSSDHVPICTNCGFLFLKKLTLNFMDAMRH
jgi:hypothetical protein